MLARTAESLFWLARYIERAENVARMVLVGQRMTSLSLSLGNTGNEWQSTLIAAGCEEGFAARHPQATTAAVVDYLVRDPDNPSSVLSCLETARRNARGVRTALTADMWDTLNDTWLRARATDPAEFRPDRVTGFLEWVKERSLAFSGAYANTMLRNDAYWFTRLGTFIERADNTARILDVKYHVLLPRNEAIGGALDHAQWQALLRSVSAQRAYHWVYHDALKPWLVAELLILRPEMPRSLRRCYDEIAQQLDRLTDAYGGRQGEAHRLAGQTAARLRYGRIEDVFQTGLHEFLTDFVDRTVHLGDEISRLYLR